MANHPPYSLVLTYTEDPRQLVMQAVDSARRLRSSRELWKYRFFLDDDDFKFDDELARQLGVAALNVIAAGRPDIKHCLALTQHPIDRPSEE